MATLRRFFRIDRGTVDVPAAIADELEFHFRSTIDDLMAGGMTPEQASAEAHRRFGDLERTRMGLQAIDSARVTQERRARWWSGVLQDLRYAVRGLRLSPGFTLGVVLTLALGIGANATMFSIIDPLLFRAPEHLASPELTHRLYVGMTDNGVEQFRSSFSYQQYLDFQADSHDFSSLVAYSTPTMAIGTTDAREFRVAGVSASFWQEFPVQPVVGRFFGADEDRPPLGEPVVVLGWSYWQSQFGGRRDVIGSHLRIGRLDYTIIGVAPRDLVGFDLRQPVAFLPITSLANNNSVRLPSGMGYFEGYSLNWVRLAAQRKPEVSRAAAEADFQTAVVRSYQRRRELQPTAPPVEEVRPRAILSAVQNEAGPNRSSSTRVGTWLVGVALMVLLIACANVGNLLLARALRRRREIALRLALGVTRGRLLVQLLTESALLALLGAAAGVGIASWGGVLLQRTLMSDAEMAPPGITSRLVVFSAVVMAVAALLCSIAPIAMVLRSDLAGTLKGGGGRGSYHRSRLRVTLLVVQGALSMVLLVGAGLFVSSLRAVNAEPLGYDVEHVAFVAPVERGAGRTEDEATALQERLLARAEQLPGVVAAARAVTVPFHTDWARDIFVPGIDSVGRLGDFIFQAVTGGYFATMGTRIVQGRGLTERDREGSEPVMVVSESMARLLWPGTNPLGQCVKVGADSMPCQNVVGVAEDIKRGSMRDDPGLMYYVPIAQVPVAASGLFVRTSAPAAQQLAELRRGLQPEMPGMDYLDVTPLVDLIAPELRPWQLGATMFTVFGLLALLVASIGLYSVISYSVAQRRQEMGIRVALGSPKESVVRLIVADALRMMAMAIGVGMAVALVAGKWVAPLLFHTSPRDPVILAGVAIALLLVGVGAAVMPAWRAATVDPMSAIRSE